LALNPLLPPVAFLVFICIRLATDCVSHLEECIERLFNETDNRRAKFLIFYIVHLHHW
jgi:hypothetical protein